MADDLDKFVLQYTVEMKDAISRLEKLNEKVDGVAKNNSKVKKSFEELARGSSEELGKVIPGLDKVSAAMKLMSAEFAVAAVAVAALAVGVKAVMDLRTQYNAQRKEGMETGVSSLRMEEYQRKFVKGSNGQVSRQTAADEVKKFSDMISSAYADPTRMGTEARRLKMLGIDPGERGKGSTPVNTALTRLGDIFSRMSPAQVQGIAKSNGMDQDFALTLQKLGPSVGKVTELTLSEIDARNKSQDSLSKFNDELAKMNEAFNEAEIALGTKLLPALTSLAGVFEKIASYLPVVSSATEAANPDLKAPATHWYTSLAQKMTRFAKYGPLGMAFDGLYPPIKAIEQEHERRKQAESPEGKTAASKAQEAAADKLLDGADQQNKQGIKSANDMNLAVNMFAGAVSAFSNAIDEKQAWAAWAGEAGKAAGLTHNAPAGSAINPSGPTKYDQIFNEAGSKYGVSPDLLRRVAKVESSMNPNAVSDKGAVGLMQVEPSNFKSLGITDGTDPRQSIMGGAQLLASYIKKAGGDIRQGLIYYHSGFDPSGYGPKTRAYPGQVLGDAANDPNAGESRAKMNLRMVQSNIAEKLGVPLSQIQQGGINRGDVAWRVEQLEGGIHNNIMSLNRQLQTVGLPQQTRSKIMTEIRDQQRGLGLMNTYGGQVIAGAQEGPRSITIGERAVIINVMGTADPTSTAQAVADHLDTQISDIVNGSATRLKY